jgi:hyperosmotically inducible protein
MFTRIMAGAFVLLAMAPAARAESLQTAPAAPMDARQIFNAVQRQVLQYPSFTIFDSVDVQIQEGVVALSGRVTMPFKRTDLETRVARVEGVTAVQNNIEVLPVSGFDNDLRIRIARAIYGHSNFTPYASMTHAPIHIVVENGHVTLTGIVTSNIERLLAGSEASHSPAFSVTNSLRTNAEAEAELFKL